MNTCVLMAKIVSNPELRYTPDQLALANMLVEFPGVGPNDPPATIKAVGWGNLATEIQNNYHEGEEVIIHGRLRMNTIDRQEGFKEKRAELTVSHIYKIGSLSSPAPLTNQVVPLSNKVVSINRANSPSDDHNYYEEEFQEEGTNGNLDDIPF
jgi:single-strand DNA-binding protein